MTLATSLVLGFFTLMAFADSSKPEIIRAKNSRCSVKVSGGEYPSYKVYRDKDILYAPKSDGVVKALISPSGKYVALSAGETNLLDVEKDKFDYGVVIINCATGKIKGYRKGQPTLIQKWSTDSKVLELAEGVSLTIDGDDAK